MTGKDLLITILRFVLLVLAQVFIFNKINFGGIANPMIYPLFIILLPFETNKNLSLFIAFMLGLSVDLFTGSIGLHTSASVFLAFVRPLAYSIVSSNKVYESGVKPGINNLGIRWFVTYSAFLVFSHHLFFFFVEAFSFDEIWHTLVKTTLSFFLSMFLIILLDVIFKPQKK
ncbi:MAG: hypothetical protein KAG84_00930 [Bacteroidales bacterium]|nr:hypothetical protein [Bacteroidales bacterium]